MTLSRQQATELFESLGATVQGMTSTKTDLVIVGHEPGQRKLQRAKELGVPFMPFSMFVTLGFLEDRPGPRTDLDNDLLTEVALQMGVACNALFAHFIATNDEYYFHAFGIGVQSLASFLRGAWGAAVDRGAEDDDEESLEGILEPERCFKVASYGWQLVSVILNRSSLSETAEGK